MPSNRRHLVGEVQPADDLDMGGWQSDQELSSFPNADFALLSATALITPYLATSVIAGPTPGLTVSWDGVNQISAGGWNPPDLNIASGQDAIVTTVNDHIDIYDKIGVSLLSESLNAFFGVAASNFVFDPRVIYDQYTGRYIIIADDQTGSSSVIHIAVSKNSDILNGWNFQDLNVKQGTSWLDYPVLGIDSANVYISGNYFTIGSNSYTSSGFLALNKSTLEAGTSTPYFQFDPSNLGAQFTDLYVSAHMYGSSPNFSGDFFVSYLQNNFGNDTLEVLRMDSAGTGSSVHSFQSLNVGDISSMGPAGARQLGSSVLIDDGDQRIQNAIWRNNKLYATTEIRVGSGNTAHDVVHWFVVDTTNPAALAISSQGNIDEGVDFDTFYGNLTVDSAGNIIIGYSYSGSSSYASTKYAVINPGGTALQDSGVSVSQGVGINTNGRWGDYSGIAIDPVDDKSFWVFNEYATASNSWATKIGGVQVVTLGDLTATNASLSSPGFSYKINNAGTVAVAASTTGIYLSSDGIIDPADILLATHATPRLAGGAFDSENVSVAALFPGNLTPGTYYLGAIANYDGVVAESNTANNASAAVPVILGNNGDNTLIGTTGNDVIFGGAGNDTIDGGAGNDTIDGGAGNDLIILGSGSNLVDGGVGQDTVQLNYRVADINLTQTASGLWALNHGTGIDTITGVERLNFLDGRIDLLDSVTGQGYQAAYYEYHGSVYTGAHYFYTGITGQAYAGEVLTVDSVGRPLSERFTGVTGAPYSAYEYDFIGGVYSSSKFTITAVPAGATYSSYEADYAFDNAYQGAKFFFTDILGQSYTGEEVDTDVSGHATRVLLTGITGLGYSTLEEDFSGGSFSDYKAYFTGITGQSYSGLEVDVTAGNVLTRAVYTGMTGTPYSAFEQDFTDGTLTGTKFEFTNISGAPYYAYEVEQDATSAIRRETLFNSDGSHSIIGFQDNLRFTALGNDTFTGGGSGETFVLNPVFGHDTITDFYQHMTGAGHDLIQLSTSDFADFAALTNSAQDINGGVLITGLSGDTLTLIGLNKATLGGLAADFSFT